MNDLTPDPVDVQAPVRALAWTPSRGFVDDVDELLEAQGEGEVILDVTDPVSGAIFGLVEAVEGDCPLSVAVRQDRELLELQRVTARLVDRRVTRFVDFVARWPRTIAWVTFAVCAAVVAAALT